MTAADNGWLGRAMTISLAGHGVLAAFLAVSLHSPAGSKLLLPPIRAYTVRLSGAVPRAAKEEAPPAPPKGVSLAKPEEAAPPEKKEILAKPKEEKKPLPETAAKGAAAPSVLSGAAAGGIAGLEAEEFQHVWYLDTIQRRIAEQWVKPSIEGVPADAVVYFRIRRDGKITDVEVRQSSGDSVYDRAAQRAVTSASPMPPLPKTFTRDFLGVHFTFLREAT
jgi:TonB family protein